VLVILLQKEQLISNRNICKVKGNAETLIFLSQTMDVISMLDDRHNMKMPAFSAQTIYLKLASSC